MRRQTKYGPARLAYAEALDVTGTKHSAPGRYTPRTNGKVERFNGTLAREWDVLSYYNHERPHSALGGRPPISSPSRTPWNQRPETPHLVNPGGVSSAPFTFVVCA